MIAIKILFFVGVILNLVKGVELLLRPHQRKQIQEFFEDITLRFDDLKMSDLVEKVNTPAIRAVIITMAYVDCIVFLIINTTVQYFIFQNRVEEKTFEQVQTFNFVVLGLGIVTLMFAWRWPLPQIISWIFRDVSRSAIVRRFAVILSPLVIAFFFLVSYSKDQITNSQFISVYRWWLWIIAPILIVYYVLFQCVGLVLSTSIDIAKNRLAKQLLLYRAILWRIVEYEKGALSALILVLTIVLGILSTIITGK